MRGTGKRGAIATASLLLVASAASCGGSSEADRFLEKQPDEGSPLTAEDRLVERKLVTAGDIAREPAGSVERAFLEYWSAIGYEEWSVAADFLSAEVRSALTAQYLAAAFRLEGQTSLPVRPIIRDVLTTRGQTAVRYFARTSSGELRATSMAWTRRDGRWYVVYSPTLDVSYGSAVQQAVQADIDPTASRASRRALQAGARASRAQAKTLALPSGNPGLPAQADEPVLSGE